MPQRPQLLQPLRPEPEAAARTGDALPLTRRSSIGWMLTGRPGTSGQPTPEGPRELRHSKGEMRANLALLVQLFNELKISYFRAGASTSNVATKPPILHPRPSLGTVLATSTSAPSSRSSSNKRPDPERQQHQQVQQHRHQPRRDGLLGELQVSSSSSSSGSSSQATTSTVRAAVAEAAASGDMEQV